MPRLPTAEFDFLTARRRSGGLAKCEKNESCQVYSAIAKGRFPHGYQTLPTLL